MYRPVAETVPTDGLPPVTLSTAHVTEGSLPPVTVALNCWVAEHAMPAEVGLIATTIVPASLLDEVVDCDVPPPQLISINASTKLNAHKITGCTRRISSPVDLSELGPPPSRNGRKQELL